VVVVVVVMMMRRRMRMLRMLRRRMLLMMLMTLMMMMMRVRRMMTMMVAMQLREREGAEAELMTLAKSMMLEEATRAVLLLWRIKNLPTTSREDRYRPPP
jgi:hypothetical protein